MFYQIAQDSFDLGADDVPVSDFLCLPGLLYIKYGRTDGLGGHGIAGDFIAKGFGIIPEGRQILQIEDAAPRGGYKGREKEKENEVDVVGGGG